jgi:isoquinoline 1-oxidoreductase beta subunit
MRRPTEGLANLSRRTFLQSAGLVAGGLVLGFPSSARAAAGAGTELGPWIRIAEDGLVTVWVEKAEMGQGIHSALAALVAEELEVAWARVRVESRPIAGPLRRVVTGASSSVRDSWEPLRLAGAAARSMLVAAAAETWSLPPTACEARAGRVEHVATGRSLDYGRLVGRAATMSVPASVTLKSPGELRLLGKPFPRLDVPEKASGAATFGIDVKVEGMAHAAPAMSPYPGGSLAGGDRDAALEAPGVGAVVEIPNGVAVVAEHYWQAKRGLEKLAPVFSGGEPPVDSPVYSARLLEALATPGLPVGETGDVDGAFAGAERVVEARYEVPFLAHATMEPMNCTARATRDRCELWAPTQGPSRVRQDVAEALGIAPEDVTVHTTLMGGGFGRRIETDFAVQAAVVSKAVSRPVKLIWSREDDIRHDFYRPACAAHLRAVVDAEGRPTAFVNHVAGPWADRELPGWLRSAVGSAEKKIGSPLAPDFLPDFVWWRLPAVVRSGVDWIVTGSGPSLGYDVPVQRLEYSLVENSLPVGWWRAVPASQHAFFVESFVDELAHAAGADPYRYRRSLLPARERAVLDRAAEMAGWGRDDRALGIAIFSMAETTVCQVAEVSADASGAATVERVFCAIDCGSVVNPDTVRGQAEGSILFGLAAALRGRITVRNGEVEQSNFHDYPMLRLGDVPEIEVQIIESREAPGGVGEPATPPIAPAVANALFVATGRRVRELPLEG